MLITAPPFPTPKPVFPVVIVVAETCIDANTVQSAIAEIVKKYETTDGVTCTTVSKGNGLNLVKMMFNQEFGKEFMKPANMELKPSAKIPPSVI